ncbi:DUF3626 domain-containing protein [Streptomyces sp. NPDC102381]|uniref:DUF3626 domain-containing protein n=1 Tax=Streptomyces sp. NPDC102381 TaxID=3366164 RepID=UPI003820F4C5
MAWGSIPLPGPARRPDTEPGTAVRLRHGAPPRTPRLNRRRGSICPPVRTALHPRGRRRHRLGRQGGQGGPHRRPKCGALNVMRHADGAAPRFGSCVRLRPEVSERATFCFGDSHVGPADIGTLDALHPVLAATVVDAAAIGRAAASAVTDPLDWAAYGDPEEVLQYIKQLWHCVAWFGSPSVTSAM